MGCGLGTHLTGTFAGFILVLHSLSAPSGWLPADYREVLVLREIEGKTLGEAAHAMGRSPEDLCGEMLRVLGELASATSVSESTPLRLVGDRHAATPTSPDEETSS